MIVATNDIINFFSPTCPSRGALPRSRGSFHRLIMHERDLQHLERGWCAKAQQGQGKGQVIMDLKRFILRGQVLSLYREALRTVRVAPAHLRGKRANTHPPLLSRVPSPLPYLIGRWIHGLTCPQRRARGGWAATDELRRQVRGEFVANESQADQVQIRYLLSEGKRKVKELDEMLCGVR